LWRLVDEADRVFDASPPEPDPVRLEQAERVYGQAAAFEERIQMQAAPVQPRSAAVPLELW